MKGYNQRRNGNDVMSTFLHLYKLCMVHLHYEIISIIQEFSSTMGSNEEIMNLLFSCNFVNWPLRNWWRVNINIFGSYPVETYSRNWIWPRSIFIIGSVWRWNCYSTYINLKNVILWGIIQICKIFAKTWHCLLCFGVRNSFWHFALTRECSLHLRPCEKTRKAYFAGGLAGFSKTMCSLPE